MTTEVALIKMIKNLIIVGMGGQGVKLISTLLRRAIGSKFGRFSGLEERGGAQRYGPVSSAIRFSTEPDYKGPLALDFKDGGCDWVLSLEASEPLRYDRKLGKGTVIVTDSYIVPPTNVRREDGDYFSLEELSNHYEDRGCELFVRPFRELAKANTNNPLNANLLALGFLLKHMDGLVEVDDFSELLNDSQLKVLGHGFDSGAKA
jgi:indolepyruvate ferredoxin oxidoreductase beta subunit